MSDDDDGSMADEILSNKYMQFAKDDEVRRHREELEGYYEEWMMERLDDVYFGGNDGNVGDFDKAYERSLDKLWASQSGRLGPCMLGVLSNLIALEGGREYVCRMHEGILGGNRGELLNIFLGRGGVASLAMRTLPNSSGGHQHWRRRGCTG